MATVAGKPLPPALRIALLLVVRYPALPANCTQAIEHPSCHGLDFRVLGLGV